MTVRKVMAYQDEDGDLFKTWKDLAECQRRLALIRLVREVQTLDKTLGRFEDVMWEIMENCPEKLSEILQKWPDEEPMDGA